MPPRCASAATLTLPFLYPTLFRPAGSYIARASRARLHTESEAINGTATTQHSASSESLERSRLNPAPDDYAISIFTDKTRVSVRAGPGGNGCISFLRELFIPNGPANGGDGGHGGNIYIQAVHGETSLHKLARRGTIRAERGKTGQGKSRAGERGDDVVIQVPVGTVVRELHRTDPVAEENMLYQQGREMAREFERKLRAAEDVAESRGHDPSRARVADMEEPEHPNLHKFVLYPGISNSERRDLKLPRLPRRERIYHQPPGPIHLDLSTPTPRPILLATGGVGGLGNPHFVSKDRPRPLFATKGERGVTMEFELELKLLADVGLVGLPNAGKSTLLRAISNSRARVGNWAFTTLQPNIGTVVLDNNKGRRLYPAPRPQRPPTHAVINDARFGNVVVAQPEQLAGAGGGPQPRTRFTVADIPGLIEGAHLDRGLGMEFLRHVERAGVLAFVVDLSRGDAVAALKSLWNEVGLYARMREGEEQEREVAGRIDWEGDGGGGGMGGGRGGPAPGQMLMADMDEAFPLGGGSDSEGGLHIAAKPWFVVATKGDIEGTDQNFARLRDYLADVTNGSEPHPSGVDGAWVEDCAAIPVSAINGHGVDRIVRWIIGLLDE